MGSAVKYLLNVASLELDPDKCTGCGLCLEVCPHNVFSLESRKAVITDKDRCMECGACSSNCAFGALRAGKGVGCAAALINSMVTGGEPACGCSDNPDTSTCC